MHQPVLSELLESIHKSDYFPWQRHRWNTNEEIAAILISFDKHEHWLSKEVKIRSELSYNSNLKEFESIFSFWFDLIFILILRYDKLIESN